MSERITSKRWAIAGFWASGLIGGAVLWGTHQGGEHVMQTHADQALSSPNSYAVNKGSYAAGLVAGEVIEGALTLTAMTMLGRRALRFGALPRTQYLVSKYVTGNSPTAIPKASLPGQVLQQQVSDTEMVPPAASHPEAQYILAAGEELLLSGHPNGSAIEFMTGWGAHPDCPEEERARIAATLRALQAPPTY